MIKAKRTRKRATAKQTHQVWAEANKKGGYIIYCGVKGTDAKTIAGGATSRETLDYNMRKARHKFGLSI
tara:strand:- start:2474 stop:2680 length:207 start_codon:yes stop_codon:yes gene_type:complete